MDKRPGLRAADRAGSSGNKNHSVSCGEGLVSTQLATAFAEGETGERRAENVEGEEEKLTKYAVGPCGAQILRSRNSHDHHNQTQSGFDSQQKIVFSDKVLPTGRGLDKERWQVKVTNGSRKSKPPCDALELPLIKSPWGVAV